MDSTFQARDRANVRLAELVDTALEVYLELGAPAAAKFLTNAGASFATVVRVLSEPEKRRAVVKVTSA